MQYLVGIDLGTTHCAISASPVGSPGAKHYDVPQLIAPGEVASRRLLPSFLYLPAEGELSAGSTQLPWGDSTPLVGEVARTLGASTPNRMVASAKSWLVHGGVDRRAPILPWSAPLEAPHISPAEASALLLKHLRDAWDNAHPDAPLSEQEVVVTVPASFDNVAKELTLEAAREAGLNKVLLLEEPQAVFYDYLGTFQDDITAHLKDTKLVLVVDVGGGTTDLTLVKVMPPDETGLPQLERIAVGGHLMLGGDNMDAALAHHIQRQAGIDPSRPGSGKALDPTEWAALVQQARSAKESLLGKDAPEQTVVTLRRRGSRLIGATKSITLTRETAETLLLDGFFPFSQRDEIASRKGRAGLTTLGLPYATDPAIPKHICTFLRRHSEAAREAGATIVDGLPMPDRILLNGGVFHASAISQRLDMVLNHWFKAPIARLPHTSLDIAVAQGATRYAMSRHGLGIAIAGGAAHAYYIGVEDADGVQRALCVAPKGMEEGSTVEVRERVFELVVGQPVEFPIFSTTDGNTHKPGEFTSTEDLETLPPIRTVLRTKGESWIGDAGVPVTLSTTLTESGTLELYLVTIQLPPRRWRLEFSLHPSKSTDDEPKPKPKRPAKPRLPDGFGRAQKMFKRAFGPKASDPKAAKSLRKELERALGPRGTWSSDTCRALWDVGISCADHRGISTTHEQTWLRLMGWCLRPGAGAFGDDERIASLWSLRTEGLLHPKDKGNWSEWWVMWRRAALGLSTSQQRTLFGELKLVLEGQQSNPPKHGKPEMVRLIATMEGLTATQKEQAGQLFFRYKKKVGSWWPLGRLGARQPFRGSPRDIVTADIAAAWLEEVLALDWNKAEGASFAAVMLAALTESDRDIPDALRARVLSRLRQSKAPNPQIRMVKEVVILSDSDAKKVLGDALPTGLRMTGY